METVKRERNSNFELLRICAMLMIVGGHYFSHGAGLGNGVITNIVVYSNVFTNGYSGAAIFCLLTGWFLCETCFNFSKLLRIASEIVFYSYLWLIVLCVFFEGGVLASTDIIKAVFPISSGINWFASTYVGAYCFLPFLQKACMYFHENRKLYSYFIGLCSALFIIIGCITPSNAWVSNLSWMIFMFFVGDYIRFFVDINRFSMKCCLIVLSSIFAIEAILTLTLEFLSSHVSTLFYELISNLSGRYSPVVFITAIVYVIIFSKFSFKSKIINRIASTTFGIYLIHDNELVRDIIWNRLLKTELYMDGNIQVIHFFATSLLVFVVCALIDWIRMMTMEKIWLKFTNGFSNKVNKSIKEVIPNGFTSNK